MEIRPDTYRQLMTLTSDKDAGRLAAEEVAHAADTFLDLAKSCASNAMPERCYFFTMIAEGLLSTAINVQNASRR